MFEIWPENKKSGYPWSIHLRLKIVLKIIKNNILYVKNFFFNLSDRVCRPVLPPETDYPSGPEGRELVVGRRDEHQDRRLRLQQRVRARKQTRYLLRKSALRSTRTFSGSVLNKSYIEKCIYIDHKKTRHL